MFPVATAQARLSSQNLRQSDSPRASDDRERIEFMDIDTPPHGSPSLDALLAAGGGLAARVNAAADAQSDQEEEEPTTPRGAMLPGNESNGGGMTRTRSSLDLANHGIQLTSPIQPIMFWSPGGKSIPAETGAADAPVVQGRVKRELSFSRRTLTPQDLVRGSTSENTAASGEGTHYQALQPLFELSVDGHYQAPTVYQPTPEGLRTLVAAHTRHNAVDFRVHEKGADTPDFVQLRVSEFLNTADLSALNENHPIGVILSHQQMHAIPLFLAMRDGKKYLLVLDSTSGPIQQQYWAVARDFPDLKVWLNAGTRQADNQSCINDAFEILKQCFTLGNLIDSVESRRVASEPSNPAQAGRNTNSRLRIQRAQQPENFSSFRLPEELAFVVQRAAYLDEVGVNMDKPITVEGRTCPLGMHTMIATEFGRKTRVDEQGESTTTRMRANTYLFDASRRHRDIIEAELRASQP